MELCSFSNLSVTSPTSQLILQPFLRFTYVIAHSPTLPLLHLRQSSFSNPSFASPTSQTLHLIHSAHSPTFPSFHLRHSSFSNPSVALPMSQLILQPFRCFTYVTAHSPTLLSLLLRHRLFKEFILQLFRHFTYVTTHSPTLPSLYLRHSSFSNHSVASPTSQSILQPVFRFSYVTSSSLNSLCSFSKFSVTSPTSQLILQLFFCFSYVTSSSLNSPGEPPVYLCIASVYDNIFLLLDILKLIYFHRNISIYG